MRDINNPSIESYREIAEHYLKHNKLDDALLVCKKLLALKPDDIITLKAVGIILHKQGKFEQAKEYYLKVLKNRPKDSDVLTFLGIVYKENSQLSNAIENLNKAVRIQKNSSLAWHTLGDCYKLLNKLDSALNAYQKAAIYEPKNHHITKKIATVFLLQGKFLQAWHKKEKRIDIIHHFSEASKKYLWKGESLDNKKLVVLWEQGLGDSIQFIRYIDILKKLYHCYIIVVCQEELYGLFQSVKNIDELIAQGSKTNPEFNIKCQFDYWTLLLSLPYHLNTDLNSIPAQVPYLYANPSKIQYWQTRIQHGFNVGIVWAGSPTHDNDRNRSCHLRQFAPLAKIPKVNLFSLQKGKAVEQTTLLPQAFELIRLDNELNDFTDTAALLSVLDLLISVDTAPVHLAGALGRSVWVLLPYAPDWRWMLNRNDSPWYPSMRLFRQAKSGDWESVFQQIAKELRTLTTIL